MSALLSNPPPSRPKTLRPAAPDCNDRARLEELERHSPEELKMMAIASFTLLRCYERIGKERIACAFGFNARQKAYGKSTIYYWLDPRAEERCPPAEFVLWLQKQVERHTLPPQGVRCA